MTLYRENAAPIVLVAEDHNYDKIILEEVFARAGITADLRFVSDGEQMLDYLHRRGRYGEEVSAPTPALILLDLNMPRLDGRKVIRIMRADDNLRHLPVIALSTSESQKHITEAYSIGINAYMVKPANIPDYVAKIASLWHFWMVTASLPAVEAPAMSAGKIRALLVDDAEIEFRSLQRMLHKLPKPLYRLDWAPSYAEGLAALQRDQHDVYLIDFKLGPDSGLDLIRTAREWGVVKPIILLTAYGNAAVDAAATEIGANDYLAKGDFDAVILDRAVRYATRQARNIVEMERRLAETRAVIARLQLETERRTLAEIELSNLLGRMVSEQEAERRRITRELHDNIGQSLTLLQIGLGSRKGCQVPGCAMAEDAAALLEVTRNMSVELHRLAWEIRPAALDDLGLESAIGQLAAEWGKHSGLTFSLHLALGGRRLPPDVESAIYRVAQEAITNVVRHSQASQVGIILKLRNNEVTCIIEDDGRGIEGDPLQQVRPETKRLGLLGMKERLALVGGTLELEFTRGRGAAVFLRAPLPASVGAEGDA